MAEDEQKEATVPSAQRDDELNVGQLDEASGGLRLRSSRLSSSDHPTGVRHRSEHFSSLLCCG